MKKRIIPSILLKSGSTNACLSHQFSPWRTIGTLAQQLKLHVSRGCDELLVINPYHASVASSPLTSRLVKLITKNTDIPVGYCGGIISTQIAVQSINECFDKVFVTRAFLDDDNSLPAMVSVLGTQSVGVCLPYACDRSTGERFVWDFRRQSFLRTHPLEFYIRKASCEGAGEILLYSVERDGSMKGFDEDILPVLERLRVSRPLLLGGGAGKPKDFVSVLKSDYVQGVVAASIFSLTEETPRTLRDYCLNAGIPMRRA
ncbi:HisA/HisF-related TIM barrel protein [Synechococcus sp. HK01-R]|uniref:HisA/HisF-related TIM barrel protein n=1 Tax=Synechococcus sp. HK01-R TaxID=2751171 RepID=UPI00162704A9|nr:HisA/HisF-related TIM barrel protein [Synechococcus sp. HK01-R]QNG27765.1 hypothetical protein H0O21_04030 [Synechococcus sp. HK01-R]